MIGKPLKEEWKPVKGYEGLYEVSNMGQVRIAPRTVRKRGNKTSLYEGKLLSPVAYENGKKTGVSLSVTLCDGEKRGISKVLHGRQKTHHGFTFKFVNSNDLDSGDFGNNAIKVMAIKGAQVIKAKSLYELAKKLGVSNTALDYASKHDTKIKGFTIRKE